MQSAYFALMPGQACSSSCECGSEKACATLGPAGTPTFCYFIAPSPCLTQLGTSRLLTCWASGVQHSVCHDSQIVVCLQRALLPCLRGLQAKCSLPRLSAHHWHRDSLAISRPPHRGKNHLALGAVCRQVRRPYSAAPGGQFRCQPSGGIKLRA